MMRPIEMGKSMSDRSIRKFDNICWSWSGESFPRYFSRDSRWLPKNPQTKIWNDGFPRNFPRRSENSHKSTEFPETPARGNASRAVGSLSDRWKKSEFYTYMGLYHYSKAPFWRLRKEIIKQRKNFKPRGLWMSCGYAWDRFVNEDMPRRSVDNKTVMLLRNSVRQVMIDWPRIAAQGYHGITDRFTLSYPNIL
jgi:hypothetical protein